MSTRAELGTLRPPCTSQAAFPLREVAQAYQGVVSSHCTAQTPTLGSGNLQKKSSFSYVILEKQKEMHHTALSEGGRQPQTGTSILKVTDLGYFPVFSQLLLKSPRPAAVRLFCLTITLPLPLNDGTKQLQQLCS